MDDTLRFHPDQIEVWTLLIFPALFQATSNPD